MLDNFDSFPPNFHYFTKLATGPGSFSIQRLYRTPAPVHGGAVETQTDYQEFLTHVNKILGIFGGKGALQFPTAWVHSFLALLHHRLRPSILCHFLSPSCLQPVILASGHIRGFFSLQR